MFSAIILSAALTAGACENGVCRAPVRGVVEKAKTVFVEKQVVRQSVRRVREVQPVRRVAKRVVFWR